MPLYKRTEWQPKAHPKGIEQDHLVFHIPYTGEVFLEYEDYIERVESYSEPEWSCCLTGKKNLTLQQAMDSEKAAGQKLNQFPETHLEAVVRLMHHAPGNADALVDIIYDAFRERYVVGEEVHHEVDGNSVLAVVTAVHKVRKEVTVEMMVNGHTTSKKGKKTAKKEGEEEKATAKKGKWTKRDEEGGETETKKGEGNKGKKEDGEEKTGSKKGKKTKKEDGEEGEEKPKKKSHKKKVKEEEKEEAERGTSKKGKEKKAENQGEGEEDGKEGKSAKKTPKKAKAVDGPEGKSTAKGKKNDDEANEKKTKSAKGTKKKGQKSDADDELPLKLTAKTAEGKGVKREAPEEGEEDAPQKSTATKKAKTMKKKKKEGEEEEKGGVSSRPNTPAKNKKRDVEEDAVSVKSQKSTKSSKEEGEKEPMMQLVTKIEVTYLYDIEYTEEGWEGKTAANVPQEELSRTGSRHPLPKPMLRAFVRDSAKREPFIGSVWCVKDDYVQRFNLPTELPPEVAALKERWDHKEEARAKRKKQEEGEEEEDKQKKKPKKQEEKEKKKVEKIQYPIEDNDLPTDPLLQPRPIESTDFLFGKEQGGSLFKTWHFMHQFSAIIKLSRFPLEDYERALLHAEDEQSREAGPDPNPLLLAVYCALLNALAEDMAVVHQPDSGSDGETDVEAKSVATTEAEVMPWADRGTWEDTLTWYLEKQARGPRKVLIPPELLKRGLSFTSLGAVDKLRLVEYLVDEVAEADGVREVVESNLEEARLLLHERRMERAAYKKIVREEQAERRRQKQLQRQNGEDGEESDNSEESEQTEQQEDQDDQPDLKKLLEEGRGSRRAILEYQRMVREKEEQRKQQELEEKRREQAAKSAEVRAAAAERKKMEEREREEQRKEAKFQETMSRLLGVRAEPLGQDRANNTYWYLDPTRLLVEHTDGTVGYYSSQLELDQLLGHLNIKGVREMQLSDRLQHLYKTMHTAMRKRQEELKREEDGRRSARLQARNKDNAYMYYENSLAEDH